MQVPEAYPFDPTLVHEWLALSAARVPGKDALVCGGERWSYEQLNDASQHLADCLLDKGLRRQDRVVIFADNSPDLVVALFGVLKAGGVFVIVTGSVKASRLAYMLRDCGASMVIGHASKAGVIREALEEADARCASVWMGEPGPVIRELGGETLLWEEALERGRMLDVAGAAHRLKRERAACNTLDLAGLIYTSGSTGEPKGVMCSHANVIAVSRSVAQYLGHRSDDVILNVLPLSFGYGLYQVFMSIMCGSSVVLEQSFFMHQLLNQIARERVTAFPMVPTIAAMLLRLGDLGGYDLSSLRYLTNAGAAIPPEHIKRLQELLPQTRFYSMYGLTECQRVCYLDPDEVERRPDSVGKPIPNCEVFIMDEEGQEVRPGETGELAVRGPHVMLGYWGDPELSARIFKAGKYPGERLLYSGDLFRRDQDGYLYFVSRKYDIIKCRGERIGAREVENILCTLEGVAEAAVVGIPDEILGQAIRAYLVLNDHAPLTERDVLRFCVEKMESFMVPKSVVFLPSLPKTQNGKCDKKTIKQWTEAGAQLNTVQKG